MKHERILIVVDLPAEKADDLALADGEGDVLDGRDRPIAFREMVDLNHREGPRRSRTVAKYSTALRRVP